MLMPVRQRDPVLVENWSNIFEGCGLYAILPQYRVVGSTSGLCILAPSPSRQLAVKYMQHLQRLDRFLLLD